MSKHLGMDEPDDTEVEQEEEAPGVGLNTLLAASPGRKRKRDTSQQQQQQQQQRHPNNLKKPALGRHAALAALMAPLGPEALVAPKLQPHVVIDLTQDEDSDDHASEDACAKVQQGPQPPAAACPLHQAGAARLAAAAAAVGANAQDSALHGRFMGGLSSLLLTSRARACGAKPAAGLQAAERATGSVSGVGAGAPLAAGHAVKAEPAQDGQASAGAAQLGAGQNQQGQQLSWQRNPHLGDYGASGQVARASMQVTGADDPPGPGACCHAAGPQQTSGAAPTAAGPAPALQSPASEYQSAAQHSASQEQHDAVAVLQQAADALMLQGKDARMHASAAASVEQPHAARELTPMASPPSPPQPLPVPRMPSDEVQPASSDDAARGLAGQVSDTELSGQPGQPQLASTSGPLLPLATSSDHMPGSGDFRHVLQQPADANGTGSGVQQTESLQATGMQAGGEALSLAEQEEAEEKQGPQGESTSPPHAAGQQQVQQQGLAAAGAAPATATAGKVSGGGKVRGLPRRSELRDLLAQRSLWGLIPKGPSAGPRKHALSRRMVRSKPTPFLHANTMKPRTGGATPNTAARALQKHVQRAAAAAAAAGPPAPPDSQQQAPMEEQLQQEASPAQPDQQRPSAAQTAGAATLSAPPKSRTPALPKQAAAAPSASSQPAEEARPKVVAPAPAPARPKPVAAAKPPHAPQPAKPNKATAMPKQAAKPAAACAVNGQRRAAARSGASAGSSGSTSPAAEAMGPQPLQPQVQVLQATDARAQQLLLAACLEGNRPLDVLSQRFTGMTAAWFKATLQRTIAGVRARHAAEDITPAACHVQLVETLAVTPSDPAAPLKEQQREARSTKCKVADLLMKQVARQLRKDMQEVTALEVLNNLPAELSCEDRLEVYTVGPEDPRVGLRGEKGVRAKADIPAGSILGVYTGYHMLGFEYAAFQSSPPSQLLARMVRDLDAWQAARQQGAAKSKQQGHDDQLLELPGPLRDALSCLYYVNEEAAGQLLQQLLGTCTTITEVTPAPAAAAAAAAPGPSNSKQSGSAKSAGGKQPAAAGRNGSTGSMLRAQAPVAAVRQVLCSAMAAELRSPAAWRSHNPQVPPGMEHDPDLLTCWLELDEAEWLLSCEVYGADFNTGELEGSFGTKLGQLLQSCAPSRQHARMLHADNNITVSAQALHQQHLARRQQRASSCAAPSVVRFFNDPATTLPNNSLDSNEVYEQEDSNAQEVVVQVAGWPLLFLIAKHNITRGAILSYRYGIQYWKHVLEKQTMRDRCRRMLNMAIKLQLAQAAAQGPPC